VPSYVDNHPPEEFTQVGILSRGPLSKVSVHDLEGYWGRRRNGGR
jgi:hypothetical protein